MSLGECLGQCERVVCRVQCKRQRWLFPEHRPGAEKQGYRGEEQCEGEYYLAQLLESWLWLTDDEHRERPPGQRRRNAVGEQHQGHPSSHFHQAAANHIPPQNHSARKGDKDLFKLGYHYIIGTWGALWAPGGNVHSTNQADVQVELLNSNTTTILSSRSLEALEGFHTSFQGLCTRGWGCHMP